MICRTLHDVHLACSADHCRRVLMGPPAEWLPAADALGDGRVRAWVGLGGGIRIDKEVEVTVGRPAFDAGRLVVPIRWHATGPDRLFPVFDGEFRLRSMRPGVCRLSLAGTYEPPLGDLGRRLEERGLRRVAESTVRDLVETVATRVSDLAVRRPERTGAA